MRREMRAARRALSPAARLDADKTIRRFIRSLPAYRAARRVALFFAFDGEPDLSALIRFDERKEFFAPVIKATDMHFAAIKADCVLAPNDFGIPEPTVLDLMDPRALDLVLAPLVAFDAHGNRVGVGAGYYDRCFGFLRMRSRWRRPKLVGTAYALQRLDAIEANPWDVPLWGAVTENGIEYFATSH